MRLQASRRVKRLKIASRSKPPASPPTASPAGRLRPNNAESCRKPRRRHLPPLCHLHSSSSAERQTRSIHVPRRTPQLQSRASAPPDTLPPTSRFRRQAGQNRGGTQDFPAQTPEFGRSKPRESPTEKGRDAIRPYRAMRRKPRKNSTNDTVLPSFCGDLPRFPAIV